MVGSGVRRGAVQYFVARPQFSAWSDLDGSRLGVLSRGSCSDWYMRELLRHHGIDPEKDVTIVGLGPRYPQILDMLAQGELDGAIISEPHVTIGEEAGYFNVWLGLNRCDFAPRMQWTIVVANNDALAQEGDVIAAVLRGCRRSYRYAAEHRDEWADFGARYFGISHATMVRSIEREFDDLHFDCEIDMQGHAGGDCPAAKARKRTGLTANERCPGLAFRHCADKPGMPNRAWSSIAPRRNAQSTIPA